MRKGDKVRMIALRSTRGTVFMSLETELRTKVVGRVQGGPDAVDCVQVKFPGVEGLLEVPVELLTTVRVL